MTLIDFHMLKQLHIWDKPNGCGVSSSYVVLDPVDQRIVERFCFAAMVYCCLSLC